MATEVAEVIRLAMEFPPAEREEIARTLLESIDDADDQAELDAAWRTEIRRRIEDIRSGKVKTLTREEADAILAERRAARGI